MDYNEKLNKLFEKHQSEMCTDKVPNIFYHYTSFQGLEARQSHEIAIKNIRLK